MIDLRVFAVVSILSVWFCGFVCVYDCLVARLMLVGGGYLSEFPGFCLCFYLIDLFNACVDITILVACLTCCGLRWF